MTNIKKNNSWHDANTTHNTINYPRTLGPTSHINIEL
jgi:hypothetical protein